MNTKATKITLNLLAAGLAVCLIGLYAKNQSLLNRLCREDGAIEWLTMFFYLIAAGLFFFMGRKPGFERIWYWGFGLLFFVIAGEEISWGQRVFGVATPEALQDANVQQEMNLHNLSGIHDKVRAMALIFILGVCYAIPAMHRFSSHMAAFHRKIKLPIYPFGAVGLTTIAILFMAIPRLFFNEIIFSLDELGEFYLSAGFLMFAWTEYEHSREKTSLPKFQTQPARA